MSEKMIKWGFIGCGEVTKTKSGPAFQKVEHSEVVAVMSRDGAKAKAYAKERGIKKWYDDAQELIDDPEVNAVYIATPLSLAYAFAFAPSRLITATTSECSTFWKAGPLFVLVTSPQPMKPHLIIFSLII